MVAAAVGTVTSAMVVAEDWSTATRVTVVAAVAVASGAVTAKAGPASPARTAPVTPAGPPGAELNQSRAGGVKSPGVVLDG